MASQDGRDNIGLSNDAQSLAGDGTVIALLKAHRTLLTTLAAGITIAGAVVVGGRLSTNPAEATAAAPAYAEGDDVPLSVDLTGNLRTSGGGGGGGNPTGGRLDSIRRIDTLRYLVAGRMDSVRRIDTLRYLAAGRLDSVRRIDTLRYLADGRLDSVGTVLNLFGTNPISSGANDFPSRSANAVPVRDVREPFTGIYSFTLVDQAGVAAANNFLCLFNPSGSNDTLVVLSAFVNQYSVAAAATKNSLRATRVTTCTVGTLQAAAAINKYSTSFANASAEVRTGNPTVTAAAEILAWPPNEAITAAGTTAAGFWDWTPVERFTLVPGEGIVFRQTIAGDVDQTYNIRIAWGERAH